MSGGNGGVSLLARDDIGAIGGRSEGGGGEGEVVIYALECGEESFGGIEAVGEGLLEVTCWGIACVVGHWGDGEGEVALYEDRRPPPFRPGVVSSGVGPEFWWSDGVEFRDGWVSRVVEDEGVRMGLVSEGVIFDVGWEEGDAVWLLATAPGCRRLDCVNDLKKGLSGGGEVRCHGCCVVGLFVFCGCEKLV